METPLTDIDALKAWIESPDPGPDHILAAGEIDELQDYLMPDEESYVDQAIEKRIKEFTAGRSLARLLMQLLGDEPSALHPGDRRMPLWPEGLTGSITHCDTHCACALARTTHIKSVGIDMEHIGRIKDGLWRQLFTDTEQERLRTLDSETQQREATIIFSAKEAFYKLQYPITRSWLNFQDAEVEFQSEDHFKLMLKKDPAELGLEACVFEGTFCYPFESTVLSQIWHICD